jgi:hypothetical protein
MELRELTVDMADCDIRVSTDFADLDIISCGWSRGRGIPNDSLAAGADEDIVPDSGAGAG